LPASQLVSSTDFLARAAARYPLLRPEQEIELGRQIRAWRDHPNGAADAPQGIRRRGERAQQRFLLCNLRLAHYIARRFNNRGVPMEDLVQSATEGLLLAVQRFDPTTGNRFSSYAVWWAQQACQIAVATQGSGLRLPTTTSEALRRVSRATTRLRGELNREPNAEEIEEAAKLKPGQLLQLRAAARAADTRSLDAPMRSGETSDSTWMDLATSDPEPGSQLEAQDLRRSLRRLVETTPTLTPQQREILRCRYLSPQPMSLVQVASSLHLNRESVRRLERSAMAILKSRGLRMRVYL
jgi:RNA polymerase sigma factor (sigma-70 family)